MISNQVRIFLIKKVIVLPAFLINSIEYDKNKNILLPKNKKELIKYIENKSNQN
jgi:hypothetical protein